MRVFSRSLVALTLLLITTACATATRQTDELLEKNTLLPSSSKVEGVPFVEQSVGHCGPATLTMALQWAGKKVNVDEIAPQVYTPGVKGSFQADMISAGRRQGMMTLPIEGMENLLKEVSAGHPVIVFENLALTWLPQWHYAVVFGYDLSKPEVLMHSGPEKNKHWDLRKFERSWMLGDYWGLVVLPPGELSSTADEMAHVRAASALESLGKLPEAEKSYQSILLRWPKSLAAAMGSANVAFTRGSHEDAIRFLEQATKNHPQSAMAWHNLAIAYGAAHKEQKAKLSAAQAMKWASSEESAAYSKTLGKWLL